MSTVVWGAVVPAAGASRRLGRDKVLAPLGDRPVLTRAVTALRSAGVGPIVVGVAAGREEEARAAALLPFALADVGVTAGGDSRAATVARCLGHLGPEVTHVLVHDAARPRCSPALARQVMDAAERAGAASAALPVVDTLHRARDGRIVGTVDRRGLWRAQTPQGFRRELLERAHAGGAEDTDDAGMVAALGAPVELVPGEPSNVKLTFPEDLPADPSPPFAIGQGYDVHRLAAGRALILGGVLIPHHRGLLGHSDADIVAHALADAVLGASGQGDIGTHFPPEDPRWAGADSIQLLERCVALAMAQGWRPAQADCLITAEQPRLGPFLPHMRARLARALQLPVARVNVKAGTAEGLGALGRQEGMAASAVVMMVRT